MSEFFESNLKFTFDDSWEVIQYDKTEEYLNISKHLPETKAVDFLAFQNKIMYFMEVKNFRQYTDENQNRLANSMDNLSTEVAQKVKDTVAAIIGIGRNSVVNESIWKKSVTQLAGKGNIAIVAWVEEDTNTLVLRKRKKSEMATRTERFKKKLSWLTSNVIIGNVQDRSIGFQNLSITPER